MSPLVVVETDPVDDLVLGLTTGFEAQIMEALDLQGAEQGLGHGVVPPIASWAHRTAHAVAAQGCMEIAAWYIESLDMNGKLGLRRVGAGTKP